MKKNVLAILAGSLLVLALFGVLEICYRLVGVKPRQYYQYPMPPMQAASVEAHISKEFVEELENNPFIGWRSRLPETDLGIYSREGREVIGPSLGCIMCPEMLAQGKYSHKAVSMISRKLIYDVQVTIDSGHRRITPQALQSEKAIVMLGDSFVFGEGVEDSETSPYILGMLRKDTQVFNLGLSGSGPGEFLYEVSLRPDKRLSDVTQEKKIFIYTVIDDHLERLICRSNCMSDGRSWAREKPYYEKIDGVLQFRGTFAERKYLNFFYGLIEKSVFLKYNNIILPPFFAQKHFDLFADVMVEAKGHLQKLFPSSEFYVVFFPTHSRPHSSTLAEVCRERGLKVLNYDAVDIYNLTKKRDHIIGDGHPSPMTNYIFAKLLDRDLPQ